MALKSKPKPKSDNNQFFDNFFSKIKDEYTSIAASATSASEFTGFINTGSLSLNALFSGSLFGGIPNNKIVAFAGESATGKTFFVLGIINNFLRENPKGMVVYYDTEAAVTKDIMEKRSIDCSRVVISEPETVQKFRTHCLKVLDTYNQIPNDDKQPLLIVLDSLGMLSTSKEMEDSTEGKDTKDMTRASIIKAAFRTITLKAARCRVPIIVTNHTYDTLNMYSAKEISGGGGLKYAASQIVTLSKKKDKDDTGVIGAIITAKMYKGRLTKQDSSVEVKLTFSRGLDKYFGLLDLALETGLVKKAPKGYLFSDGRKETETEIYKNPTEYFTDDFLQQLDKLTRTRFEYGMEDNDKAEEAINTLSFDEESVDS